MAVELLDLQEMSCGHTGVDRGDVSRVANARMDAPVPQPAVATRVADHLERRAFPSGQQCKLRPEIDLLTQLVRQGHIEKRSQLHGLGTRPLRCLASLRFRLV